MGKASRRKRETREALREIEQDPEVRKEFERIALQEVQKRLLSRRARLPGFIEAVDAQVRKQMADQIVANVEAFDKAKPYG